MHLLRLRVLLLGHDALAPSTSCLIGQLAPGDALKQSISTGRIVEAVHGAVGIAEIELGEIAVKVLFGAMLLDAFMPHSKMLKKPLTVANQLTVLIPRVAPGSTKHLGYLASDGEQDLAMDPALRIKLLGAIETDTLIFLCGAGLSIPSPSFLPSAARVAEICYEKWIVTEPLNADLRYDVDKLAGHFHATNDFETVFIPLVPWNDLSGAPNRGHAAIADLLVSRAAHAALSANFDTMIERWAEQNKIAMQGALTGQEATNFAAYSSPLLKFHGCMQRARTETLWTKGQLAEPAVQERIEGCSQWMNLHLPGKHIVVVGFWTDWGYLNDVLAAAFTLTNASAVTVVDPTPTAELQKKAKGLWDKLTTLSAAFAHIQESGDVFLEELRVAYSRSWARKFYALGQPLAVASGITHAPSPDGLEGEDLYNLRRDAEGVPYTRAATMKAPPAAAAEAAFAHIELTSNGAAQSGAWLSFGGQTIRIVNGAGRGLNDVRQAHVEPPNLVQPNIVMCAGAVDLGVPARLIATGKGASIVSPAPGGGAQWMTRDQTRTALGL